MMPNHLAGLKQATKIVVLCKLLYKLLITCIIVFHFCIGLLLSCLSKCVFNQIYDTHINLNDQTHRGSLEIVKLQPNTLVNKITVNMYNQMKNKGR